MAAIRPFRALRFNPERVTDLSRALAPPYDVIDAEAQARLYEASPQNIVRLILAKASAEDTEQENRYTRAARDFAAWNADAVLRRDPQPALYLLEHTFTDGGQARSRLGFIALLELGGAAGAPVYRHEATLAAPKADRSKLLDAVPANLEPIFCVYPDAGGTVQARLRGLSDQAEPTVQATINGDTLRLWTITEPRVIREVAAGVAPSSVLIADGHHRFEVAYARRSRYPAMMSYFVSMEEPALAVRPIHRVVRHEGTADLDALRRICAVEPARDLASVFRWLHEEPAVVTSVSGPAAAKAPEVDAPQGRFGYTNGNGLYRVTVQPERLVRWLMAPTVPFPVAALDVSLLAELVLPGLGFGPGPVEGGVRYIPDAAEALRAVDRGQGHSAWLLRAIPLPQVYALAAHGFALPSKSTYFYPKVPSGLTINPLI